MKAKIFFWMSEVKSDLSAFLSLDNIILCTAVGIILLLAIIMFFKRDTQTWRKSAPSLITTSGIFCTFVGVSIGLARFNPDDSNSLKYLLAGLKLAFIPSAIAIFLAIVFKWISSKQSSENIGMKFMDKIAENTAAIERLVTAVSAVDWQVKYKQSLEVNIDKNAELLAVLQNSLAELLQYLRDKPTSLAGAIHGLEDGVKEISGILHKVNTNLSTEVNQITNHFKLELENHYSVTKDEIQNLFQEINRLNQTVQQLGGDAVTIRDEILKATHDISQNVGSQINQKLNTTLNEKRAS